MRNFLKLFIVTTTVLVLCLMLPVGLFADNSYKEEQDVVEAAKEAELFAELIRGKGYAAAYEYSQGIENELTAFCSKNGYLDEESGEGLWMNPYKSDSEVKYLYYPFAKEFDTLKKWDDEVLNYFTSDFLGLIPHSVSEYGFIYLREYQGKTYVGSEDSTELFYSIDWGKVELTSRTAESALLTVGVKDNYGYDGEMKTLHLIKTDDGWRVDGGTFWELDFADYEYTPPETGDPTAAYALIFTLAALPLAGLCVAEWKRRRRAV